VVLREEEKEAGMKTLVIGGTGKVGSLVTAGLLKQGIAVRVMSHSSDKLNKLPAGVEGVQADLDHAETLRAAFDKIDSLFLLTVVGPGETDEGLNAVSTATAAGVKKIVHMSLFMPEGSEGIPHFRSKILIEKAVKESGITFTILRPNNFFQNDLWLKDSIARYGVYPTPLGNTGVNRVDVRDIADCAVNALTISGHAGGTYAVIGPDTLTGDRIAGIYTKHLGREVRYAGDDLDAWAEKAKAMMPEFLVANMKIMFRYFQEHGMIASKDDLAGVQKLLGRKPRTFDAFVKEITDAWRSTVTKAA
jgi:uncharacterized protein YbjT (DUF2867 family)